MIELGDPVLANRRDFLFRLKFPKRSSDGV